MGRGRSRWVIGLLAVAALIVQGSFAGAGPAEATGTAPALLSNDRTAVDSASQYGSGAFGHWSVDRFGLPAYDYTVDQQSDPVARQPELAGNTSAWSQIGNDHIVANAYNSGYVQLWSQDRLYQWMNDYDGAADHFSGGFGYLDIGGRVLSTLYDDRPAGATTTRTFGVGYYAKSLSIPGVREADTVYAPFGDNPVLLHDVTITNTRRSTLQGSYFEYWDVNPQIQGNLSTSPRGYTAPVYDSSTRTLSVTQRPDQNDSDPLSIFASALDAPVASYDADTTAFFGTGTRAVPAAVAAGHLSDRRAPADANGSVGKAMFAFQSPFHLAPGKSVTFRYAYGFGHPAQIADMVHTYRAALDPLGKSEGSWERWLPKVSVGSADPWLSREAEWDAYMVRSDATYDAMCGYHTLSQGGYYQYALGSNIASRDPLQIMLPMIYADPALARQVIEFAAHEQSRDTGKIPYGIGSGCRPTNLGNSDDLDQWLLWGTAEYVLATRDFAFLRQAVPYFANTGSGTMLAHLQLAFDHQERAFGHGPHGEYLAGTGDWSDLSSQYLGMTESDLVTAQAAYIYPLLAGVVGHAGDDGFAAELKQVGARDLAVVKGQFVTGPVGGWYARGYAGNAQIGAGAMFEEPQPWAIFAGAPSPRQAAAVVAAYRRFLVGVGAPAAEGGPSKIGAALTPAASDPLVSQRSQPTVNDAAGFPGGSWFDVNGWMVLALGDLQHVVPGATTDAWNEFLRNTLAAHATAFPDSWDGIVSVDDVCAAYYQPNRSICGAGLTTTYDTQIPDQSAYSLFDLVDLAGVTPTTDGYEIDPRLPMRTFTLRMPDVGVARQPGELRGYVRPVSGGNLVMTVASPPGVAPSKVKVFAGSAPEAHSVVDGMVRFVLHTVSGGVTDWAVVAAR